MSSPNKNSASSSVSKYEVLPNGCEAHWEVVERILFIYAKLNPGIAYVQGMNEIVGPLYYTFATDPSSEWKGKAVPSAAQPLSPPPRKTDQGTLGRWALSSRAAHVPVVGLFPLRQARGLVRIISGVFSGSNVLEHECVLIS